MLQEHTFDCLGGYFPPRHVDLIAQASAQENSGAAHFGEVAGAVAALARIFVRVGPVTFCHRGAAHFQAATLSGAEGYILQRSAHIGRVGPRLLAGIISDATALSRAVKVVQFEAGFLENVLFQREC